MAKKFDTSSIQQILRFPFQGPDWQTRFLAGAALMFLNFIVPFVPGVFVLGYLLDIEKRAIEGKPLELPAWDDFSKLGWTGLRGTVLGLVFLLPALAAMLAGFIFYFIGFLSLMWHPGPELHSVFPFRMFLGMVIWIIAANIGSGLGLIGGGLLPFAGAHLVVHDRLSAGFDFRAWWRLLWTNRWGYFLAWAVTLGLFQVLSFGIMSLSVTIVLGLLIPFLMPALGFYVGLVGAAFFGRTYRQSREMLEKQDGGK